MLLSDLHSPRILGTGISEEARCGQTVVYLRLQSSIIVLFLSLNQWTLSILNNCSGHRAKDGERNVEESNEMFSYKGFLMEWSWSLELPSSDWYLIGVSLILIIWWISHKSQLYYHISLSHVVFDKIHSAAITIFILCISITIVVLASKSDFVQN